MPSSFLFYGTVASSSRRITYRSSNAASRSASQTRLKCQKSCRSDSRSADCAKLAPDIASSTSTDAM